MHGWAARTDVVLHTESMTARRRSRRTKGWERNGYPPGWEVQTVSDDAWISVVEAAEVLDMSPTRVRVLAGPVLRLAQSEDGRGGLLGESVTDLAGRRASSSWIGRARLGVWHAIRIVVFNV